MPFKKSTKKDGAILPGVLSTVADYRKMFLIIVLVVVMIGVFLAMIKPPVYQYSQLMGVASYQDHSQKVFFQRPQDMIVLIKKIYLPKATRTYQEQQPKNVVSYNAIKVDVVKGGDYILFTVMSDEKQKAQYEAVLNTMLMDIFQLENQWINVKRQFLSYELSQNEKELVLLNKGVQGQFNVEFQKILVNKAINRIQMQLASIQNSFFLNRLTPALKPTCVCKCMIVLLALLVGLMLGFASVFASKRFKGFKR